MNLPPPVKVLHVSETDVKGRRFNGFDLIQELRPYGIEGQQSVLTKESDSPVVHSLLSGHADTVVQAAITRIEQRHSLNNVLYPWGRVLAKSPEFAEADVVYYHLIQNHVVSLLDLPELLQAKPSVWTFHNPWPLTGHCVHPRECRGWLTGCAPCPRPEEFFALAVDRSHELWQLKQGVLAGDDLHVVVASEFMRDMVARSPLTAHLRSVHLIPFGVDADAYLPDEKQTESRARFGIPPDDFVIALRGSSYPPKGVAFAVQALSQRPPKRPTTILVVDGGVSVRSLANDYRVIELGWTDDAMVHVYSAADIFLMPSTAEAFGLMALEAMAAGRPVISFEGTAVPWVTSAPECGISVPLGDAGGLREAIDWMSSDEGELRRRGRLGRERARSHFSHRSYLERLSSLYRMVSSMERSAGQ